MNTITKFTDLIAWQNARDLGIVVYRVTMNFPKEEIYGMTSQVRRAIISVSSNIAEGFSRRTAKDKNSFYIIARGSLMEVESQMIISKDLGFIEAEELKIFLEKKTDVGKLINGLIKSSSDHNT